MAMYLTHFTCNYEAWPSDQEGQKAAWARTIKDANANVQDGSVNFIGWVNNT